MRTHRYAITASLMRAIPGAGAVGGNRYAEPEASTERAMEMPDESFRNSGHPSFDAAVRALGPIWRYGPFTPGYTETLYMGEPGPNFIAMPGPERFENADAYRQTVAHELVHWSQHASRANRPAEGLTPFAEMLGIIPDGYRLEEATAEMGGALLVDALGAAPALEWSARYVKNWTDEATGQAELLEKAAERAEQAVDWLLARMTAGSR